MARGPLQRRGTICAGSCETINRPDDPGAVRRGWLKNLAVSASRLEQAEEALRELTSNILERVTDGSTLHWIAIETEQLRGYVEQVRSRVLLAAWAYAAGVESAAAYLPKAKRTRLSKLLGGQVPGGGFR